jgi:iron complex transport system ATP-binding protein
MASISFLMPSRVNKRVAHERSHSRSSTVVLDVRDLTVERGSSTILSRLNWTIEPGENWVVLGPNGSGKTSLIKALTGFMSPTSGDMAVLGRRYGASDWRELRLQIGVVTSAFATAIPPSETAIETVMSGKYAQLDLWTKVTRADRTAALGWLRTVGGVPLANRAWIYLSQGERQRVLIARALMAKPRLLILDEPCAGLDPVARENFLQLLTSVAQHHAARVPALVLVTHHVEEITPAFSHALMLRGGKVVAAGPTNNVLNSANLTATFGAKLNLRRSSGRYSLTIGK